MYVPFEVVPTHRLVENPAPSTPSTPIHTSSTNSAVAGISIGWKGPVGGDSWQVFLSRSTKYIIFCTETKEQFARIPYPPQNAIGCFNMKHAQINNL